MHDEEDHVEADIGVDQLCQKNVVLRDRHQTGLHQSCHCVAVVPDVFSSLHEASVRKVMVVEVVAVVVVVPVVGGGGDNSGGGGGDSSGGGGGGSSGGGASGGGGSEMSMTKMK